MTANFKHCSLIYQVRENDEEESDLFDEKFGRFKFKLHTFSDEEILSDPRVVVENVLREKGLLQGSKYAVDQIMSQFKPPRRQRPDVKSQLGYIKEEESVKYDD